MTAIVQVDWFAISHLPEIPAHCGGWPYYRVCDICDEAAYHDIWAGKLEADFRQFHRVCGGGDDGLIVCEHCLPAFLAEAVQ